MDLPFYWYCLALSKGHKVNDAKPIGDAPEMQFYYLA